MIKIFLKFIVTLFVLSLFGYFAYVYIIPKLSEHEQKQVSSEKETGIVKRVIDVTTIEVEFTGGKKEKVKLLGIDSIESKNKQKIQNNRQLSIDFVKKLIEGKKVILTSETNYEDKDSYGRLLRYVYLEDGTFVNKKIIDEGYATAHRKNRISKLDEFIQAENFASKNKKGLWNLMF